MINWKFEQFSNKATIDISEHIKEISKWVSEQEDKVLLKRLAKMGVRLCDHNCEIEEIKGKIRFIVKGLDGYMHNKESFFLWLELKELSDV